MHWPQHFHHLKLSERNSDTTCQENSHNEEHKSIQILRKELLEKAIECASDKLPYQCAVVTRAALWGSWEITAKDRFSEYKKSYHQINRNTK